MKPIATDNYDFERLVTDGYAYIDKTDMLWTLANGRNGTLFFISRPRRFGKSLMLSTFKYLFRTMRREMHGFYSTLKNNVGVIRFLMMTGVSKFAPMIAALAVKAGDDGEPILRSLEYAYPGRGYAGVIDEFMMGDDLLTVDAPLGRLPHFAFVP